VHGLDVVAGLEAAKLRTLDRQLPDELGELVVVNVGAGESSQARGGGGLPTLDVVVSTHY
jgi:hypothetical protein